MLPWSVDHVRFVRRLATAMATALVLVLLGLPMAVPSLIGPSAVRGATHAIEIGDGSFSPASLTVTVGDTVTWTNADDSPHTVTASGGAFDSGNLDAGGTFSHTFDEAGSFTYVCLYHDEMVATITVVAPSSGSGQAPADATPAASPAGAPAVAASAHGGEAHAGQPDTALPVSASLSAVWIAPLLIGLGLFALGIGLVPVPASNTSSPASPMSRRPESGWRR
jgi:plastocyanin